MTPGLPPWESCFCFDFVMTRGRLNDGVAPDQENLNPSREPVFGDFLRDHVHRGSGVAERLVVGNREEGWTRVCSPRGQIVKTARSQQVQGGITLPHCLIKCDAGMRQRLSCWGDGLER